MNRPEIWILLLSLGLWSVVNSLSATQASSFAAAPQTPSAQSGDSANADGENVGELQSTAETDQHDSPLAIDVADLDSAVVPGPERGALLLRLTVHVKVQNVSDAAVELDRSQFQLLVNGEPVTGQEGGSSAEIGSIIVAPRKEISGQLTFTDIDCSREEPSLVLKWMQKKHLVLISLTDALRSLYQFERSFCGPKNCLLVLSSERRIDLPATWVLNELLFAVSQQNVRRVVIIPVHPEAAQVTDEAILWLNSAHESFRSGRLRTGVPSRARFIEMHTGGFRRSGSGRMISAAGGAGVVCHRDPSDAIEAALKTAYDNLSPEEAFRDVLHPQYGVQRAALQSAADRLNEQQIQELLAAAAEGPLATRLLIIDSLHKVTSRQVVPLLKQFSLEENGPVSVAALTALSRCADPEVENAVREIREAAERNQNLQQRLVEAALLSKDFRWCDMLAGYAGEVIRKAAEPDSASESVDAEELRAVLDFLTQHNHRELLTAARQSVMSIRNAAVQDLVMEFVLQWKSDHDQTLIHEFLKARLNSGTISDFVRQVVHQYPNPAWTEPLITDFQRETQQSGVHRRSLSAALRCAASSQLDSLLTRFDQCDTASQSLILQHLAVVQHPEWRKLAEAALQRRQGLANDAMDVLHQDGSEESISILNAELRKLLSETTSVAPPQNDETRGLARQLISRVSLFSHPECRRTLNRCLRHPDEQIRQRAASAIQSARRRSPADVLLLEVMQLKSELKFSDALEKATQCLVTDSLMPDAYLYRASLFLRADRLEEAMQDLLVADRLCPEDLSTMSTIALVFVRTGRIAEGLQMAEEALQLDPGDNGSLYNTACVYARAAEQSPTAEEIHSVQSQRAVELLKQAAEAGFYDTEHLKNDPDLNCLHDHPEWLGIIQLVTQAQAAPGRAE